MYTLSGTLTGHESDIKAVTVIANDQLVSASRDSTVRLWKKSSSSWSATPSSIVYNADDSQFINSVAYIPDQNLIVNGGQEGIVYMTDADSVALSSEPEGAMIGHTANICSLSYHHNTLMSSSWDCTAIVWDLGSRDIKYHLKGHSHSVWDAVALGNDEFLTCSADKTIKKWKGDKVVLQYTGHQDVVRKLLLLPGGENFASCSNDGSIIIWNLNSGNIVSTLYGHNSFIYDLALLPNGNIVSVSEDRTVRIWNDSEVLQAIALPCVSVWCCDTFSNGDIVVGGSDKQLRIFTADANRFAEKSEIAAFAEEVKSSTIAEQSLDDLKKTDIPSYEALSRAGKKEGEILMVKNPQGVIEAHQWSGGTWTKIGDVVGAGGSTGKQDYHGQKYDYVFDVDVKEGEPPLKLPFNANDNPYEAAAKFLADNELPSSYQDQVVNFILQNTGGVSLDAAPTSNSTSGNATQGTVKSTSGPSIIPQTSYVMFEDYKPEQLMKGLTKFNSEQTANKLDEYELNLVKENLKTLTSVKSLYLISEIVPKIFKWPASSRLIGYDILRICINKLTISDILKSLEPAEIISKAISEGIKIVNGESLPLFMMLLKVINNLIPTVIFQQLYCTASEDNKISYSSEFMDIFSEISRKTKSITSEFNNKFYLSTMTTLASVVFNLSVLQVKNSGFQSNPYTAQPVLQFIDEVGEIIVEAGSEPAYRAVVAIGNFKHAKALKETPEFVSFADTLYNKNKKEERFKEIEVELSSL